jgi:hypothetical protein
MYLPHSVYYLSIDVHLVISPFGHCESYYCEEETKFKDLSPKSESRKAEQVLWEEGRYQ